MTPKKKKCPICGTKMKYENGDAVCGGCGYRASFSASGYTVNTTNSNYNSPNRTNPRSYTSTQSEETAKKIYRFIAYALIIFFGVTFIRLALYHFIIIPITKEIKPTEQADNTDSNFDDDITAYSREPEEETSPRAKHSSKTSIKKLRLPESELFQQFLAKLFEKDYQKVTAKELAQVTALHLYEKEGYLIIAYTLNGDSTGSYYFNQNSLNSTDFACFPQLQSLEIHNSLSTGALDGLTKLTKLSCRNSPQELLSIIDPLQLTELEIDNDLFLQGIENIEAFSNVEHLRLESVHAKDLSPLLKLEHLTTLELIDCERVEDFSALYQMPQLESLTVDSNKLRDISFVSNMPNLKELSIQNSLVIKLDALADCADTLQKLDLSSNYKVADRNYTVVSQLTNLTQLTLTASYDHEDPPFLPQLANMPKLTQLSIQGYDDFSPIADAPLLEKVTLTRCYANDYSALESLPHLTSLCLNDISIMENTLETVGKLTSLEQLYLDDDFIWGDCNTLLNLPNLKEYSMKDCTTGFDVNNIQLNENLKILYLSHITTKALVDGKWDYQSNNENNFYLADYADIFQNYPNLEELYLAENTLSDVTFAKELKHLKVFDITDNYVTDLSPLSELAELKSILCAHNAVVNDGGLRTDIILKN
ncbi:MAG: leucine-rich repeat domain-containing protein [Lachnospiraceae bacterium]|nr:leucine-rich repeat domain-containing protein [Lachnospiraceae bacterium]